MDCDTFTVYGSAETSDKVGWLVKQGWEFKIELAEQMPFGAYRITIPDRNQRFMFFMTWGRQ